MAKVDITAMNNYGERTEYLLSQFENYLKVGR
jgi:hypothetical protein